MTLVAGISDEDSGVASSMFNARQQVGGAVGAVLAFLIALVTIMVRREDLAPGSSERHPG